jgi:hypothetical protein
MREAIPALVKLSGLTVSKADIDKNPNPVGEESFSSKYSLSKE